jgi:intergrase/recombinase
LGKLNDIPIKYQIVWKLLLDSGLRLTEAVKIVNEFKPESVERVNGFCRMSLGQFRGSKQTYYAYFTEPTLKMLVQHNHDSLNPLNVSHYLNKYGLTAPKYLRKFVFDTMITLGIPESVADFIEGRVAKRIGAKHYMSLMRQADGFYGRYQAKIAELQNTQCLNQGNDIYT